MIVNTKSNTILYIELLDIDIADESIFQKATLPLSMANQRNFKKAAAKVTMSGQSHARMPLFLYNRLYHFSKLKKKYKNKERKKKKVLEKSKTFTSWQE